MIKNSIPNERFFLIPDVQPRLIQQQPAHNFDFVPLEGKYDGLNQIRLCDPGVDNAGIRMLTCSKCMIATVADQVRMINIQQKTSVMLQLLPIQGKVYQAVTSQEAVYLATDKGKVLKFDLANQQQLDVMSFDDAPMVWPRGMAIHNQFIYITTNAGYLYTLNAQNLKLVDKLQLFDPFKEQIMNPVGLALVNEHIYVQCKNCLITLKITNPMKPQMIDILKAQVNTVYDQRNGADQFFEMTANEKGIYATYNRTFQQGVDTKAFLMVFPFAKNHCPKIPHMLQLHLEQQVLACDNDIRVMGDFVHIFTRHEMETQTISIKDIQRPIPLNIKLIDQFEIEQPASMTTIDGKICFASRLGELTMIHDGRERKNLNEQMREVEKKMQVVKKTMATYQHNKEELIKQKILEQLK